MALTPRGYGASSRRRGPQPDLGPVESAELLPRAVGHEAEPRVEGAPARVALEDPERHARPPVAPQSVEGGVEQRGSDAGAPVAGVDIDRGDLGGPCLGVAVPARCGERAEPDDGAVALGDEHAPRAARRDGSRAPSTPERVERHLVEGAPAVLRLAAADVDRRDGAGVGDGRVADDGRGGADQAPDSSQSPRLVKPTITTSM